VQHNVIIDSVTMIQWCRSYVNGVADMLLFACKSRCSYNNWDSSYLFKIQKCGTEEPGGPWCWHFGYVI